MRASAVRLTGLPKAKTSGPGRFIRLRSCGATADTSGCALHTSADRLLEPREEVVAAAVAEQLARLKPDGGNLLLVGGTARPEHARELAGLDFVIHGLAVTAGDAFAPVQAAIAAA